MWDGVFYLVTRSPYIFLNSQKLLGMQYKDRDMVQAIEFSRGSEVRDTHILVVYSIERFYVFIAVGIQ